jgi:hypothetical protein
MPYELLPNFAPPPFVEMQIVVSEDGKESQPFSIGTTSDQIHVVTPCDRSGAIGVACPGIVTHADGSLVSGQSPARPGETIIIYAWGLGNTTPRVKTGELSPSPAPVLDLVGHPGGLGVELNFARNAAPSDPSGHVAFVPAFLTPGQIGLYQINVQLPDPFPSGLEACGGGIRSNLTINLRGVFSLDGAAFCAQP